MTFEMTPPGPAVESRVASVNQGGILLPKYAQN